MKLFKIVLKDVLRRKRRVLYAALGVVISTMTVIGILTIIEAGEAKIYNQLEQYGPNLTVLPAINNLDVRLGNISLGILSVGDNYINESEVPRIQEIADTEIKQALGIQDTGTIATVAPKLFVNTEVNGSSVVVVGIRPQEELRIKTWWSIREGEQIESGYNAVVGTMAAGILQLGVGDTIVLNGATVTIIGILEESGANDDYQIFMPLETLQEIFNKQGLISLIDIRALCTGCPVEVIADGINAAVPGVRAIAVKQVAEAEMNMMNNMNQFMIALAGITLAVGLFGVINTMIASVNERIKDIGIMKAVGASRNQIIGIFIYEAVIIGLLGGIFGYIAGTALAYVVGPLIFENVAITFIPRYFLLSLGLAILIAVIAVIYPTLHATRVKIADSFRSL